MKKKLLMFVLVLCLIMPCAIMLTACNEGEPAPKSLVKIEIQDGDRQDSNLSYTYDYNQTLDFVSRDLKLIGFYSDGTNSELTLDEYAQVETEISTSSETWEPFNLSPYSQLDEGWYQIRIKFGTSYAYINLTIMPIDSQNTNAIMHITRKSDSQSVSAIEYSAGEMVNTEIEQNTFIQHFNSAYALSFSINGWGTLKTSEIEEVYFLTTAQKEDFDAIDIKIPDTDETDVLRTRAAKQEFLKNCSEQTGVFSMLTWNRDKVRDNLGNESETEFEFYTDNSDLKPGTAMAPKYYYAYAKVSKQNYNDFYTTPSGNTRFRVDKKVLSLPDILVDNIEDTITMILNGNYLTEEEQATLSEQEQEELNNERIHEQIMSIPSAIDNSGMTQEEYVEYLISTKMTTFEQIKEYLNVTANLDYNRKFGDYPNDYYIIGNTTLGQLNEMEIIRKDPLYSRRLALVINGSTSGWTVKPVFVQTSTSVNYNNNGTYYTYKLVFESEYDDEYYTLTDNVFNDVPLNMVQGRVQAPRTTEYNLVYDPDHDTYLVQYVDHINCEYNYGNEQSLEIFNYDSDLMQLTGTLSASAIGNYTVSFALKDSINYAFVEEESGYYGEEGRIFNWSIVKRRIGNALASLTYAGEPKDESYPIVYDGEHNTINIELSSSIIYDWDNELQEYVEVRHDNEYFAGNREYSWTIETDNIGATIDTTATGLTNTLTFDGATEFVSYSTYAKIVIYSSADDYFEEFTKELYIYINPAE
ncbi:MAG: hypothetical protein IJS68_03885 [Clostridia bacterium]|nr:hypothetical protein [Clostridia bacterium]